MLLEAWRGGSIASEREWEPFAVIAPRHPDRFQEVWD